MRCHQPPNTQIEWRLRAFEGGKELPRYYAAKRLLGGVPGFLIQSQAHWMGPEITLPLQKSPASAPRLLNPCLPMPTCGGSGPA